jgi:hypothetical protein
MKSGINELMIEVAMNAHGETGWELTPSQVRDNIECQAREDIDLWLETGRTDQFSCSYRAR